MGFVSVNPPLDNQAFADFRGPHQRLVGFDRRRHVRAGCPADYRDTVSALQDRAGVNSIVWNSDRYPAMKFLSPR